MFWFITALEENMFDSSSTSPYPQLFLKPRETVHVPFKFQTFRADHSVPEQVHVMMFALNLFARSIPNGGVYVFQSLLNYFNM